MIPQFAFVDNVLLPISCKIGSGMTLLHIFGEEMVALLAVMTDKLM